MTLLRDYASEIWACDFLQSHDLLFHSLFVFVIIELGSRRSTSTSHRVPEILNHARFHQRVGPSVSRRVVSRFLLGGLHRDCQWRVDERMSYPRAAQRMGISGQDSPSRSDSPSRDPTRQQGHRPLGLSRSLRLRRCPSAETRPKLCATGQHPMPEPGAGPPSSTHFPHIGRATPEGSSQLEQPPRHLHVPSVGGGCRRT